MFHYIPAFISIIPVSIFANSPIIDKDKNDLKLGLPPIQWLFCLFPGKRLLRQNCPSDGSHQIVFQLGNWVDYCPDKETLPGKNYVRKIVKACALLEKWTKKSGFSRQSLLTYDKPTESWHQRWVKRSGQVIDFFGIADNQGRIFRTVQLHGQDSLNHAMAYKFKPEAEMSFNSGYKRELALAKHGLPFLNGPYKKTDR